MLRSLNTSERNQAGKRTWINLVWVLGSSKSACVFIEICLDSVLYFIESQTGTFLLSLQNCIFQMDIKH